MHNYYRDLHGSPPLECDPELAKSAQDWTDQQAAKGYMHHSEWTDQFTESISWKGWGWEGMEKMEGAIPGAVRSWYSEIKNGYNYQTGTGNGVIGHFQAVVWKGETKLGCGLNIKPDDGTYVTAHYTPPSHTSMDKEKLAPENIEPRQQPGEIHHRVFLSFRFVAVGIVRLAYKPLRWPNTVFDTCHFRSSPLNPLITTLITINQYSNQFKRLTL